MTACQVARHLPPLPTFAYTSSARTLTRMTLYRGITPRRLPEPKSPEHAAASIERDLRRKRNIARGDQVVVLSGSPKSPLGQMNRLVVHLVS